LRDKFELTKDLPVVFVDSFANVKAKEEEIGFTYQTRLLMYSLSHSAKTEPFNLLDITAVRSELSEVVHKAKKLEAALALMEGKIADLMNLNVALKKKDAEQKNPALKIESITKECLAYKNTYQYSINALYIAAVCGFLVPGIH